MSSGESVGGNLTKTTYIEHDGRHAFYAGGQTYVGRDGEAMLEVMTSEMLHWVTHDDGHIGWANLRPIVSNTAWNSRCDKLFSNHC